MTREGCQANIVFMWTDDPMFWIIKFHKGDIHHLCTPNRRQFLTVNRNVSYASKDMIGKYATANIGPSKVYSRLATMKTSRTHRKTCRVPIETLRQFGHIL